MVTVKELKEMLENVDDNAIILSSEEGNSYEIEKTDIHLNIFCYPVNGKLVDAIQIG